MTLSTAVGALGGVLTTTGPILQALKTVKSKSVRDLSLGMWYAQTLGNLLWLIYGLLINEWPVILANAFTLCCAMTILGVILTARFKRRKESVE